MERYCFLQTATLIYCDLLFFVFLQYLVLAGTVAFRYSFYVEKVFNDIFRRDCLFLLCSMHK